MAKSVNSVGFFKVSWFVSFLFFLLMVWLFLVKGSRVYLFLGIYFFIVVIAHLNRAYGLRLEVWFVRSVTFFRYFLDSLFDNPFRAWFVNYLLLSFLLLISGEGFIVSFIASLPISAFTFFAFLPIAFLVLLGVVVVESIFKEFVDRKEYKKIVEYYENLKLKKEKKAIENLQRDIKYLQESKGKENSNSALWFLAGLGAGWFLFNE